MPPDKLQADYLIPNIVKRLRDLVGSFANKKEVYSPREVEVEKEKK
jgi:hypothetical protein